LPQNQTFFGLGLLQRTPARCGEQSAPSFLACALGCAALAAGCCVCPAVCAAAGTERATSAKTNVNFFIE
jgi:hypothetical protein